MKSIDKQTEKIVLTAPPLEDETLDISPSEATALTETKTENSWGWLPILTLVSACALLLLAISNTAARAGTGWAQPLMWTALLTILVPTAVRLASPGASRNERIGLIVMVGLAIYMVKVLHSPLFFTFHDEFVHVRTADDILRTGHLFEKNPIIPVSPLYPALQILTTALLNLTGLDIYAAGILVVGAGRLLLVLALFLLYEEISSSARVAGLAVLVYMCNPNFVFYGAQFAYESLSLPFVAWVLFLVARRARLAGTDRVMTNLAVVLGLAVITTAHHLTSYAVVAFFALWAISGFLWRVLTKLAQRYTGQISNRELVRDIAQQLSPWWKGNWGSTHRTLDKSRPAGVMLLMAVACLSWLVYVATLTIGYLAPVLRDALAEVIRLIAGEAGRELFKGSSGQVAPPWEQLTAFGAVGLIMLGLLFGTLQIWRHYYNNTLALTLTIVALVYPASLAMRFTTAGWEVANRASEFVFISVAFIVAVGVERVLLNQGFKFSVPGFNLGSAIARRNSLIASRMNGLRAGVFTFCVGVAFVGGMIAGWPPFARQPGTYLVSADTRSIEPQGVAAANWAQKTLGPGNRMAADRINGLLMLSFGGQYMVLNVGDGVNVGWLFYARDVDTIARDVINKGNIRYVVVDKRLSKGLPQIGVYFESGEPDTNKHTKPLDLVNLEKFDRQAQVQRVFDSGDIAIYDVGELLNGR